MKTIIIAILTGFLLVGCTSEKDFEKGKEQLENMGYSNIENTGYNAFCCSEKDTYSTGFKCTDKKGREVKGCICSGAWKGITIRFE